MRAKQVPLDKLAQKGNIGSDVRFPITKGVDVAGYIAGVLLPHSWIDWDTHPELEDIGSLASELDWQTDDKKLWQELFEKVDKL